MKNACTAWLCGSVVLATLGAAAGCSTPSLSPVADDATSVRDETLIGEWRNDDYRASVSAPSESPLYKVAISAMEDGEIRSSLNLEMRATRIGGHGYIDLFLSKSERRRLSDQYGGLVIPTHQVMRYTIEGDTLSVWMLEGAGLPGDDGRTQITYGDSESEVLTAETATLRKMIETAPDDAFEKAAEFKRVR